MATKLQIRNDTTENWLLINPVLEKGEIGYESTVNKIKVGDGLTEWNKLPYLKSEGSGSSSDYDDSEIREEIEKLKTSLSDVYTKEEIEGLNHISEESLEAKNFATKEYVDETLESHGESFVSKEYGTENSGKFLGINESGEVEPVEINASITSEAGIASILDNGKPKDLFGAISTEEQIPAETVIVDRDSDCSYKANAGVAGPFIVNDQTLERNKPLASVTFMIHSINPASDEYSFYIANLGKNIITATTDLTSYVASWKAGTAYTPLFTVKLASTDTMKKLNYKLDGSDERVIYRNPDFLNDEGYFVISENHFICVGDPLFKTLLSYQKGTETPASKYSTDFYYFNGSSFTKSNGNLGYTFYERTYETKVTNSYNFDNYLTTEEGTYRSNIINDALNDIKELKENRVTTESPLKGKYISLLGDSITTFNGWSNIPPASTSSAVYYPINDIQNVEQTYWHKLVTRTGMNLLVNNSWSGSECAGPKAGAVVSTTNDRCSQLHKDGIKPDIILINIGTNDFDHDLDLGVWNGRGEKYPATTLAPTTFREAYAVMLHRLRKNYPLAKIYCCTVPCGNNEGGDFDEINGKGIYLVEFNDAIREIATAYGVRVIELATSGLDFYTLGTLYGDGRVHPNEAGMERYYEIIRHALENEDTTNVSCPKRTALMTGSIPSVTKSTASSVEEVVNEYNSLLDMLAERGIINIA